MLNLNILSSLVTGNVVAIAGGGVSDTPMGLVTEGDVGVSAIGTEGDVAGTTLETE